MSMNVLVVGAGLAGCTMARLLADAGHIVYIIEKEKEIGGICRDVKDVTHNCYAHQFGPHIFHTDNERVWEFVNRFTHIREYKLQQKSLSYGKFYDWPLNLNSLEMRFDTSNLTPDRAHRLMGLKYHGSEPTNFEEACIQDVGEELYRQFFYDYTKTQWQREPKTLPISFYKRCPIRYNREADLFPDKFQGMPDEGYTQMMLNMLDHDNIFDYPETTFENYISEVDETSLDLIVYTGGFEGLPYRSTMFNFAYEEHAYQYPVLSLPDHLVCTRKTNYSLFHPIDPKKDVRCQCVCYEMPQRDNQWNQLLPIPTEENIAKYNEVSTAFLKEHKNAMLVGRLATYKYLDMDEVIEQCMAQVDYITKHDK